MSYKKILNTAVLLRNIHELMQSIAENIVSFNFNQGKKKKVSFTIVILNNHEFMISVVKNSGHFENKL